MPKLVAMGLLSRDPLRCKVLQKFLANKFHAKGFKYSITERRHITAVWFTPGLNATWLKYQFEKLGLHPETAIRRIKKVAYNPKNRSRWEHLGQRNAELMTEKHVQIYYDRRDPRKQATHPMWVIPIFREHRKRGMTRKQIADKYNISEEAVRSVIKRNFFTPMYGETRNWWKGK